MDFWHYEMNFWHQESAKNFWEGWESAKNTVFGSSVDVFGSLKWIFGILWNAKNGRKA